MPLRKKVLRKKGLRKKALTVEQGLQKRRLYVGKPTKFNDFFDHHTVREFGKLLLLGRVDKYNRREVGEFFHVPVRQRNLYEIKFLRFLNKCILGIGMSELEWEKWCGVPFEKHKFHEEMLNLLEAYALAKFSKQQVADYMRLPVQTLNAWMDKFPIVQQYWDRGGEYVVASIVKAMTDRATGYKYQEDHVVSFQGGSDIVQITKSKAPDVNAAKLILLNKSSWQTEPIQGQVNNDKQETAWDIRKRFYEEGEEPDVS